mgnify:CR=1 FL=1
MCRSAVAATAACSEVVVREARRIQRRLDHDAEATMADALAESADHPCAGALGQHTGPSRETRLATEQLDARSMAVHVAVDHQRHELTALQRSEQLAEPVFEGDRVDRELGLGLAHRGESQRLSCTPATACSVYPQCASTTAASSQLPRCVQQITTP